MKGKKKRQLQLYCFELSKILSLEHIYLDYYYFSSMDIDKRKNMMLSNYVKRNVFIKNMMEAYEKEYNAFKQRQFKLEKRQSTDNRGIG